MIYFLNNLVYWSGRRPFHSIWPIFKCPYQWKSIGVFYQLPFYVLPTHLDIYAVFEIGLIKLTLSVSTESLSKISIGQVDPICTAKICCLGPEFVEEGV